MKKCVWNPMGVMEKSSGWKLWLRFLEWTFMVIVAGTEGRRQRGREEEKNRVQSPGHPCPDHNAHTGPRGISLQEEREARQQN